MEQKKIYPYLVDSNKMNEHYQMLLDKKFELIIFDKNKNEDIYNFFLPFIRNYMFWTFNINKKSEFDNLDNRLKAAVCGNYECNVFEKDENTIICFNTGICFAITEDEKVVEKIKKGFSAVKLQDINLRDEENYSLEKVFEKNKKDKKDKKEKVDLTPEVYAYVLQLYKMIYLNKIQKAIQSIEKFDKARNSFVDFTQEIYNVKITDDIEKKKLCDKWAEELDLDERYIRVENEFDLLYKNSKLNDNKTLLTFAIGLSVVVVIIGVINLFINLG